MNEILLRRGIAGLLCLIAVPVMFREMDERYVVPQRLKRSIEVLGVETSSEQGWLRARIQLHHRGSQPYDVAVSLAWLDAHEQEVARSRSNVHLSPGDTVNVRLAVKAPAGKQAAQTRLDWTVTSRDER